MAVLAAAHVRRFGIDAEDRAAVAFRFRLATTAASARKMREALRLLQRAPSRTRSRRRDARRYRAHRPRSASACSRIRG